MIIYKEIIKPKILSFDLDDTLYDNKDIIIHAEEEFYQHLKSNYFNNFEFSKEVYNQEKKRLVFELPELSSDVSLLRFFVLYNLLIRNGYSSSEAKKKSKELLQYFIEIRSNINISRETFDVLSSLASKYKLVVLSNGNANFQNKELGNLFDNFIYANINIGAKPSKRIFDYLLKLYNIKPLELCHVGDDEKTDVFGAYNIGAQVIWQTQYRMNEKKLRVLPNCKIENISELLQIFL